MIDFDDSSRVASPAVQVGSNRQALFDAIATIDSDGGTDLGAGLDEGCNALQQATGTKRAALFFTDGDGSYNDEAACFASKGWSVYTFGLGTSVNSAVLEEIANTTGGSYRALDSALNLTCEFQQVRAVIGGGTAQNCTPTATIKPKQLISEAFEATAGLRQLTFTNSWIGSDIEQRLADTAGTIDVQKRTLTSALDLLEHCDQLYEQASDADRKILNQAFFDRIWVYNDHIDGSLDDFLRLLTHPDLLTLLDNPAVPTTGSPSQSTASTSAKHRTERTSPSAVFHASHDAGEQTRRAKQRTNLRS